MAQQASWALVAMGPTPWAPASVYPLWPSKRREGEKRRTAELAHWAFGLLGDFMTMIYKLLFIYWVSISYQGLCELLYKQYHYSSSYVLWERNCFSYNTDKESNKEGWALKDWCFWTVALEMTLESPLDYKEIKSINPKENQLWIFTGRTDDEAEAPILWPDAKNLWKRPWWWERMKARGEGGDRGRDGWMALPTQWTWVWANSGR